MPIIRRWIAYPFASCPDSFRSADLLAAEAIAIYLREVLAILAATVTEYGDVRGGRPLGRNTGFLLGSYVCVVGDN